MTAVQSIATFMVNDLAAWNCFVAVMSGLIHQVLCTTTTPETESIEQLGLLATAVQLTSDIDML